MTLNFAERLILLVKAAFINSEFKSIITQTLRLAALRNGCFPAYSVGNFGYFNSGYRYTRQVMESAGLNCCLKSASTNSIMIPNVAMSMQLSEAVS
jgi:hypothetical protein